MRTAIVVAAAVLAACAGTFAYHDPAQPHRAQNGFRNTDPDFRRPTFTDFWTWQFQRRRDGVPRTPEGGWKFEVVSADPRAMPNPTVTWIGHATVLLRVGGLAVITDPQFSERASPFGFVGPKRVVPPAPPLESLPHIDAVVISHNHYDHLDLASVKRLSQQPGGSPRFFVPLGMKKWFSAQDIEDVVEMDWWQKQDLKGIDIHFTPVQHWSKRTLFDENQALWGGWVIKHQQLSFFFAGDTGYSADFAEIGRRFGGFDFAAIPIGAYAPRWFMRSMHNDPGEAIRMHRDLRAKRSLGIHWGTFPLTDEDMDEPPKLLAAEREKAGIAPGEFFILKHGETIPISPR